MINQFAAWRGVLALLASAGVAGGAVKPDALFSDHAVLQQGMAVPVWGTASAGEEVVVEFAGQKQTVKAGADGKWLLKLDAMPASAEPRVMKISGIVITDVLVGEVWVGAGQSNMFMPPFPYLPSTGIHPLAVNGGKPYAANQKAPGDKVLEVLVNGGPYPALRIVTGGKWQLSTPDSVKKNFSALLFSFGQPLQRELNVPVGLLVGAVGGSPSGYWLSQEAFDSDQPCKDAVVKYAPIYNNDAVNKRYEEALAKWKQKDAEAKARGEKGAPGEPKRPLRAGECNGGTIGNLYERFIRPYIPYGIRGVLWDQGESPTAVQGVNQYLMMGALIRGWRKEWGQGEFPFLYVQKPSGGGCAWDVNDPVTAWAEPFAPLPERVPQVSVGYDMHLRIAGYPNTFLVMAGDLGGGLHPFNKSGYGARACRVALGAVYGKPVEYYGPRYQSCDFKNGKAIIHFTHVGRGLAFRNGDKLQGFAIAGQEGKFVWANAVIEGDTVVVSSDQVPKPAAVRYACTDRHPWANLFNRDGLPALPFHSDEIPDGAPGWL